MKVYEDGLFPFRFLVLVLLVFPGLFFKNLTEVSEVETEAHLKLVSSFLISADSSESYQFSSKIIEL